MPYSDGFRVFPWGFASVLTRLERDGHRITVLDAYGENLTRAEVQQRLDLLDFDCVLITAFASMNYAYVEWLSGELRKRSSAPIIVGGLLAELHNDLLLLHGVADFCVIGDGEETASELLRNLACPEGVDGIAFQRREVLIRTRPRIAVRNLDELEMPRFELFQLAPYLQSPMAVHSPTARFDEYPLRNPVKLTDLSPTFAIFAGKGCPFRCEFCSRSSDSVRLKSVDRIMEEIATLKKRYGIRTVQFKDELLILNKNRTRQLCEALRKEDIFWECQSRVDTVDHDTLKMMADANCISVGLGVESGSNRMLRLMNKGISRRQIVSVLRAAREVGIHVRLQLMCGFPGETSESMDETATLFAEVGIPPRPLSWCTPLPGSTLYADLRQKGAIGHELQYVRRLAQGTNKPGRVILNASGLEDSEMAKLYDRTHLRSEASYIGYLARTPKNWTSAHFWSVLCRYLVALEVYQSDGNMASPPVCSRMRAMAISTCSRIARLLARSNENPVDASVLRQRHSVRQVLFAK